MADDWTVEVDTRRCIGSGVCASTAPGRFTLNNTGRSQPTTPTVTPEDRVLDAAYTCPMEAITITNGGTGRSVFPEEGAGV
ncbi:ferredoxin [Streptomyces sp. DSM 41014]|uniref:Ferredoxin n=1 Tax=Streptomyces hintoniae TaxID=3075521 RepID=A0ABU2UJA0_9ACTN|nr:ferredoxin [Streptomyces sp. DSM 41014]MDT0473294.1 ferredoxin [Streptomyces sp. DSM 41014]